MYYKLTMKKEQINLDHASCLLIDPPKDKKNSEELISKIHDEESDTCKLERLKHKHI